MLENSKENGCGNDPVKHPSHYQSSSGLEVIDVIKAFTEDLSGYQAVYTGNVLKYMCRWHKKNGLEDLKKAKQYLDWLIDTIEAEEANKEKSDPTLIGILEPKLSSPVFWNALFENSDFKKIWDELSDEEKQMIRLNPSDDCFIPKDKGYPSYKELLNMTSNKEEENKDE